VAYRNRIAPLVTVAALLTASLRVFGQASPAAMPAPVATASGTPAAVKATVALLPTTPKGTYPQPQRFEKAIRAFELADEKLTPPPGQIVCVGSSSMAGWHGTIQKDLAPLKVISRGFGGSNMNDALFFVDRVVLRYRPKAVVLYEGDNDIAAGIAPQVIRERFAAFAAAVHKALPQTRIYVLSIKPSPSRAALWAKAVEANRLLQAACAADAARLTYVSTVEAMMSADGKLREDLFKPDRLHMTAAGYALWREVLRPVLMKGEMAAVAEAGTGTRDVRLTSDTK
jgi:lysophospholipase L1-like esterase